MRKLFVVLVVLAVAGCDSIDGLVGRSCTAIAVAGINVKVIDSLTGAPVASGSLVRATEGTFTDSASVPANRSDLDSLSIPLVFERPGTYQVTVEHAGYRIWTKSDVRVRDSGCHVDPVSLTARLVQ